MAVMLRHGCNHQIVGLKGLGFRVEGSKGSRVVGLKALAAFEGVESSRGLKGLWGLEASMA